MILNMNNYSQPKSPGMSFIKSLRKVTKLHKVLKSKEKKTGINSVGVGNANGSMSLAYFNLFPLNDIIVLCMVLNT